MLNKKGFTLIELLVVILIIGILLALIIPNFALFQERARRTSVKNNMHVIQTALEAWATDHMGQYPHEDVVGDVLEPEGPLARYFPGGDPLIEEKYGNFPTNPYTGMAYNGGDFEDLFYGGDFVFEEPGLNAITWGGSEVQECPYLDWANAVEVSGAIAIGVYYDPATEIPQEYGIAGWGRLNEVGENYPMYDVAPGAEDPFDEASWKFFVLHN
ncbi:MAG: prepilin-type N-terminal cleavage/methylation domain-containing protein [candidate division WOR-3 bacterium]|nr:prepilin-type N-terminal cleavage/methylation domain-containing protein [candidate division WOR-3 bacterium]